MLHEKPSIRILQFGAEHRPDRRWPGLSRQRVAVGAGERRAHVEAVGPLNEVLGTFAAAGSGSAIVEIRISDCSEETVDALMAIAREKMGLR